MHPSDAARALADRCLRRVNEVARQAARGDFESLPGYAALPGDMKDLEIAATVRHGLRGFLGHGVQGGERAPEPATRSLFEERAEQRAEEGMPLDLLLSAYLRGAQVIARLLRETARPGEEAALAELLHALLDAQEQVVGTLTRGYLRARTVLSDEGRRARESLARALLEGTPSAGPRDLGVLAGAEEIGVLVVLLPDDGDGGAAGGSAGGSAGGGTAGGSAAGGSSGSGGAVASRRAERRTRLALHRALGADVPLAVDGTRVRALLPGPYDTADLGRALGVALGGRCPHGALVAAAGPAEVASAARTADRVLTVAVACGRPPGVHRLSDVLLEYHLSRPGDSAPHIAALLDPVAERPELTDTVRVHLRLARNRRATARELGVHPNTVDNRLSRFTALTGVDVTTDHGAALVLAATLLREVPHVPSSGLGSGR
ncbi:PucR family transcriptional regulator [Streptomyces sp. NPDC058812]|uniref:PucR family transcriptional regulator n=1 Tax=unclassified Streptomyces TaxID=2593676 RepID=UPI0036AB7978